MISSNNSCVTIPSFYLIVYEKTVLKVEKF